MSGFDEEISFGTSGSVTSDDSVSLTGTLDELFELLLDSLMLELVSLELGLLVSLELGLLEELLLALPLSDELVVDDEELFCEELLLLSDEVTAEELLFDADEVISEELISLLVLVVSLFEEGLLCELVLTLVSLDGRLL